MPSEPVREPGAEPLRSVQLDTAIGHHAAEISVAHPRLDEDAQIAHHEEVDGP